MNEKLAMVSVRGSELARCNRVVAFSMLLAGLPRLLPSSVPYGAAGLVVGPGQLGGGRMADFCVARPILHAVDDRYTPWVLHKYPSQHDWLDQARLGQATKGKGRVSHGR